MSEKKYNDYNNEDLNQTDTIIDEPWRHQFEESHEENPSTRSARFHAAPEASLYTKILFGVMAVLVVVVMIWVITKVVNGNKTTQQSDSQTPKLVLQTTTTTNNKQSETETTKASSESKTSSETSQSTKNESTSSQSNEAIGSTYIVQSGDSFSKIAAKHGVSLKALLVANNKSADSLIKPGDTLVIPSVSTENNVTNANRQTNSNNVYVVKAGDTLGKIAATYGMTVQQLKNLNGLSNDNLQIGQKLVVN